MGTMPQDLGDDDLDGPALCPRPPKAGGHPTKRFARGRVFRSLLIGAILGVLLGFVSFNWLGPCDPPVPADPPIESNRVYHPKGFSIVVPPNWRVDVGDFGFEPGYIAARPRWPIPIRAPLGFSVRKFGSEEPELPGEALATVFQGEPARERAVVEQVSLRYGPQFVYKLVFRRDGAWYQLRYNDPGPLPSLPDMVRQYLLTFRVDGRPSE